MKSRRYLEYLVVVILAVALSILGSLIFLPKSGETAAASSALHKIKERGVLRAGLPVSGGLPVASRDASGAVIGFLPDLAAEMAAALEVKLEVVDTTDPNRFPYLQNGTIDFAWGTITLPRNEVVSFSRPADLGAQSGLVLKSSGIADYENMGGKKIVVVTGSTGDILASKQWPNNEFVRVDAVSTAIQAVQSGQADICIGDWAAFNEAGKTDSNLLLLPILKYEAVGLMLPQGDVVWKEWVDNFLNDILVTGTTTSGDFTSIYRKWFELDPNPELMRWM